MQNTSCIGLISFVHAFGTMNDYLIIMVMCQFTTSILVNQILAIIIIQRKTEKISKIIIKGKKIQNLKIRGPK